MIRKVFISSLIVVFINFITGCSVTSNQKVSIEELNTESERISEVILTSAEKITFDENGAKLYVKENFIQGITVEGNKKSFGLNIIGNLNWVDSRDKGKANSSDPEQFLQYLKASKDKDSTFDSQQILISNIITNKDYKFNFDENGGRFIEKNVYLMGLTKEKEIVEIDKSDILYVMVARTNTSASVAASLGVLVGVFLGFALIAAVTKQSCPFVYSFDGENYIFDGEPLGGATTKGLERTELSKLEYLNVVEGKYKLLVKNEVPETQYIDQMSLLVVDHQIGTEVYADLECNISTINNFQKVIYGKDENGNEITDFVLNDDKIFWQTQLPLDETKVKNTLRHQLTFAFLKPADEQNAKLIINAGTSLWGSQMIREMQTLYGVYIDSWYDQIDEDGLAKQQMLQFIEREELYIMKAQVKEGDNWVPKTSINGGGPFIAETRTYNLDLENVIGDTLFIQFNIPYGFWTLDYLAVNYENNSEPIIQELELINAIDHNGKNISTTLFNEDDDYHLMPIVGDYFFAEAEAPEIKEGFDRTIFLKTSGYYKLHLKKDQPMQTQLLFDISSLPGEIVNYSMKRFSDWETNYNK